MSSRLSSLTISITRAEPLILRFNVPLGVFSSFSAPKIVTGGAFLVITLAIAPRNMRLSSIAWCRCSRSEAASERSPPMPRKSKNISEESTASGVGVSIQSVKDRFH